MKTKRIAIRVLRAGGLALGLAVVGIGGSASGEDGPPAGRIAEGRELFLREWTPGDSRSPHGDGLGPVFNDSSCVACHNAGGSGGGGPSSKNVDIVTAVFNGATRQAVEQSPTPPTPPPYLQRAAMALLGLQRSRALPVGTQLSPAPPPRPDTSKLLEAHPGFRTARSVVLHKSSTDPGYEAWRAMITGVSQANGDVPGINLGADAEINRLRMAAQFENNSMRAQVQLGDFELIHSQRNPTALFGIGLLDSIPDSVIEAASTVRYPDFPEVAGRVARQKDGRIGRFGWKAQVPSLHDFVLTACAVELGLEVPGHPQGGLPKPSLKTANHGVCKVELAIDGSVAPSKIATVEVARLDLTAEQCASLESYIRALPIPIRLNDADKEVEAGGTLFSKAGCVSCHSPKLGEVEGLYSDMLIHDMGAELGDTGSYTPFVPGSEDPDFIDPPISDTVAEVAPDGPSTTLVSLSSAKTPKGPATRQEWRTPPLWGVRDSSPYLHDGRAPTLDRAIALHGGQGERSAKAYFALTPRERLQVQAFLKSLAAPEEPAKFARRSERVVPGT
jgi:CxxC motif-containing protein (DUF1111 family)